MFTSVLLRFLMVVLYHIFHRLHRNPALPSPVARVGRIAKCLNRFQVRLLAFNRSQVWGIPPFASTKAIKKSTGCRPQSISGFHSSTGKASWQRQTPWPVKPSCPDCRLLRRA